MEMKLSASTTRARARIPASVADADTQLRSKVSARRTEPRSMIGATSVVTRRNRSGLASPSRSDRTSGSAADAVKNNVNPSTSAARASPTCAYTESATASVNSSTRRSAYPWASPWRDQNSLYSVCLLIPAAARRRSS